jgi:hypothetical protein
MRPHEYDGFDWIQSCVVHPVVRLAHEGQIARIVVAGTMVEMSDRHARWNL